MPHEIGERIRERRLAFGWTQQQLADEMDPPRIAQAVSEWERGRAPTADSLIALADALGCTTDYLLGRSER